MLIILIIIIDINNNNRYFINAHGGIIGFKSSNKTHEIITSKYAFYETNLLFAVAN